MPWPLSALYQYKKAFYSDEARAVAQEILATEARSQKLLKKILQKQKVRFFFVNLAPATSSRTLFMTSGKIFLILMNIMFCPIIARVKSVSAPLV